MAKKQVWIFPKRRQEIDLEKLAEGLLDLVESLTPEQFENFAADDDGLLDTIIAAASEKGSA